MGAVTGDREAYHIPTNVTNADDGLSPYQLQMKEWEREREKSKRANGRRDTLQNKVELLLKGSSRSQGMRP